jgi:hypothetical protein
VRQKPEEGARATLRTALAEGLGRDGVLPTIEDAVAGLFGRLR